jgi:hypothetical protein
MYSVQKWPTYKNHHTTVIVTVEIISIAKDINITEVMKDKALFRIQFHILSSHTNGNETNKRDHICGLYTNNLKFFSELC